MLKASWLIYRLFCKAAALAELALLSNAIYLLPAGPWPDWHSESMLFRSCHWHAPTDGRLYFPERGAGLDWKKSGDLSSLKKKYRGDHVVRQKAIGLNDNGPDSIASTKGDHADPGFPDCMVSELNHPLTSFKKTGSPLNPAGQIILRALDKVLKLSHAATAKERAAFSPQKAAIIWSSTHQIGTTGSR